MFRLTLVIVLITAAASLKHVSKARRSEESWEKCYRDKHPFRQCRPKDCTFPMYIALERVGSLEDAKKLLRVEENLEQMCREAGALLGCLTTAVIQAPAECKELYKNSWDIDSLLTEEFLSNGVTFLRDVCYPEVIESIRRNVDCILEESVIDDTDICLRPNIDKNCSGISYNTDDYSAIITACWDEKYRISCDVDDIIECASKKVAATCDEDAGGLVELIGDAFYNTLKYPICPGGPRLRTLLKYFKK